MSSDRINDFSEPAASAGPQTSRVEDQDHDAAREQTTVVLHGETVRDPAPKEATVLVRGEAPREQVAPSTPRRPQPKDAASEANGDAQANDYAQANGDASNKASTPANDAPTTQTKPKEKAPPKEVSQAKAKMQSRLPALADDSDVGIPKDYVVTRDGKADLAFTGTLLASAAPDSAPKGKWQEYRIYATNGGKHVFSKIGRSVFAEDRDTHQAEIFDPSPSSMPSQLLRSARDLTRSRPLSWSDAAVEFFGYDPLAKVLYRKVGGQFEEHIS